MLASGELFNGNEVLAILIFIFFVRLAGVLRKYITRDTDHSTDSVDRVLELQAVLVELIENFEYRFPEGVEIIRLSAGLMIPMVAGKVHEGSQMPLQVSVVS